MIAAKDDGNDDMPYEIAGLWFNSVVDVAGRSGFWSHNVINELQRCFSLPGLQEKARRNQSILNKNEE